MKYPKTANKKYLLWAHIAPVLYSHHKKYAHNILPRFFYFRNQPMTRNMTASLMQCSISLKHILSYGVSEIFHNRSTLILDRLNKYFKQQVFMRIFQILTTVWVTLNVTWEPNRPRYTNYGIAKKLIFMKFHLFPRRISTFFFHQGI